MAFSEWLSEATPDRQEVTVCFDRRLLSSLAKARADLDDIPKTDTLGDDALRAARDTVADLEAQVAAATHALVFEGIGWAAWRDLLAKHPPHKDQAETFLKAVQLGFMPHSIVNVGYHAETFIPAAIAASCTEPGISTHEAQEMLRFSPPGVIERVWTAVLEVNLAGNSDPFVVASPNGSVAALRSERK